LPVVEIVTSEPSSPADAEPVTTATPWHWVPIALFTVFTALNMLDRQLLAAAGPAIRREFGLTNQQFGLLGSAFSAASTLAAPVAGFLFDRVGLAIGAAGSLLFWSIAGMATGLTRSFGALMSARFGLAVGESGAAAAPGIVVASYLGTENWGIGAAFLAAGTSFGSIAAPLVIAAIAPRYGWRAAFLICGVAGLVWIPLWLKTASIVPPRFRVASKELVSIPGLFADRRFLALIVAYALARQTLWVTWTTLYFVDARHMAMADANRQFVWMPSVFGASGAFVAGALTLHWIRRGMTGLQARLRTCWIFSPLVLCSAAVPFIDSNGLAAVMIGLSFFGSVCVWSSAHLMPIDVFGVGRSAFTYAVLEGSFTGLQVIATPAIGALIDRYGYTLTCMVVPLLPLLGVVIATFWLTPSRVKAV
jgi:MFS transporter, ACS family, aldohexuronate transporter